MFAAFHAASTWQLLRTRQVGTCSDAAPELLEDFRRLRADMQAARLFESNKLYYAWKVCRAATTSLAHACHMLTHTPRSQCASNLGICALSLFILSASAGIPALLTSAFFMVRCFACPHLPPWCSALTCDRVPRRRSSGSSAAGCRTTFCTTRHAARSALAHSMSVAITVHFSALTRCLPTAR